MVLIKEIGLNNDNSFVSSTFTPEVKTYNITTNYMSEDCMPVQLGNGCCIWVNRNGLLGEIECIYPKIIDKKTSLLSIEERISGNPFLEIRPSNEDIVIEQMENQFIIWFSRNNYVKKEILQDEISYLITDNQVLGIIARNVEIIK